MCVVSMVYDHYWDKWSQPPYRISPTPLPYQVPVVTPYPQPFVPVVPVPVAPVVPVQLPTQAEIEEFRKLLERAREYDKRTGQPDCELEEKRAKLKKLAEEMGVDIAFI